MVMVLCSYKFKVDSGLGCLMLDVVTGPKVLKFLVVLGGFRLL